MKCGNGIDTHQDIIVQACGIFYYPPEGGNKPCKYFSKCQKWIKKVISEDERLIWRYKGEGLWCSLWNNDLPKFDICKDCLDTVKKLRDKAGEQE